MIELVLALGFLSINITLINIAYELNRIADTLKEKKNDKAELVT